MTIRGYDTREFEKFIETSYQNFVKYKDELGLALVIEYYVTSKVLGPLETSYLLGAITFECIESYLCQYFETRKMKKDLRRFKHRTKFLWEEFGVAYEESELDFVKVRDKVVHTGRFPKGKEDLKEYYGLINLLDRTLLTILGYRGNPYFNTTSMVKEVLK
jgi:hypothetical protein